MDLLARRLLSVKNAVGPSAGPDGSIYYLSDYTGQYQIWRFDWRRHDVLFPWDGRVGAMSISPRGHVAFAADVGGDERWRIYVLDGDEVSDVATEGFNNLGPWTEDGLKLAYTSTVESPADYYLYVYDRATGTSARLAELSGINAAADWCGDAVLVAHEESSRDGDIYLVGRDGVKNLTKHSGEEKNASPRCLGHGRVAYLSNRWSEYSAIALLDLNTGEAKPWVQLDREIEAFDVWENYMAYVVNEDGYSGLYIMHTPTGLTHKVGIPPGVVTSLSWRFGRLTFSLSGPQIGHEVFVYGVEVRKITESPKYGLDFSKNAVPEAVRIKASDGVVIPVLLYKPSAQPPYKAVFILHGGPESQARPYFEPLAQLLVRLGYLVVEPNFRGSTGYGKTFVTLDDGERRLNAVRDVAEVAEWAQRQGFIADRPCVMGGSYGGYLTLMSLALYPELWKCGVEIAGIVNLATFLERTAPWRRRHREAEYGRLEDRELLARLSPITYADKIAAPLLVVHGANDIRVPVGEADQLVARLRELGKEVEFLRLENEGHVLSPSARPLVYGKAVEFIKRRL
ncbi:S9 family peptidase [Thermoproteus tenax]|uniref:Acylamino-acid releasing enzyme n=1 Tax=Thermoproteus tenax (strain ATCC 35583 / DSM 2078 / JCM 9277 / NBRC 100435 / Kra 1) TaxID=768679 RepID=G4RNI1_THETK|nr:S9 family peptidase [Thermoproteus tenax]CCC81125.1 acylamino-acid releasing enzyme [Thermoproteus tenax Kra 1]